MSILFRDDRSIEEALGRFDPSKHPRARGGKFADVLGKLEGPFKYASGWEGHYDPQAGRYLGRNDIYMPRDFDPHTGRGAVEKPKPKRAVPEQEARNKVQAAIDAPHGPEKKAAVEDAVAHLQSRYSRLGSEGFVTAPHLDRESKRLDRHVAAMTPEEIQASGLKDRAAWFKQGRKRKLGQALERRSARLGESVLFADGRSIEEVLRREQTPVGFRHEFGIATRFDPAKHPRARGGKFADVLGKLHALTPGHSRSFGGHLVTRGYGADAHVFALQHGPKLVHRGTPEEVAERLAPARVAKPKPVKPKVGSQEITIGERPSGTKVTGHSQEPVMFAERDKVVLADGREGVIVRGSKYGDEPTYQVSTTPKPVSPEMAEKHAQAFHDWSSGLAYLDNNGNYRVRAFNKNTGPVADWNKAVKADFKDNFEFSAAADVVRRGGYSSGSTYHIQQVPHSQLRYAPEEMAARRGEIAKGVEKGQKISGKGVPSSADLLKSFQAMRFPKSAGMMSAYSRSHGVPMDWMIEHGYATENAGARPGVDIETMQYHYLVGHPPVTKYGPGSAGYAQWAYGLGKKYGGTGAVPAKKAEKEALLRKIAAALVAIENGDRPRYERLLEAACEMRQVFGPLFSDDEVEHLLVEGAIPVVQQHLRRAGGLMDREFGDTGGLLGRWDPRKHPRARGGRFAEVLAHLKMNGYFRSRYHGISIEKGKIGGYHVKKADGGSSFHMTAENATKAALAAHDAEARRTMGPHFLARYSPGSMKATDVPAGGRFHWNGEHYMVLKHQSSGLVSVRKESTNTQHLFAPFTDVEQPRDAPKGMARARGGSKAQALVDSGLADDLADAKAQLADMGERGGMATPGDRGEHLGQYHEEQLHMAVERQRAAGNEQIANRLQRELNARYREGTLGPYPASNRAMPGGERGLAPGDEVTGAPGSRREGMRGYVVGADEDANHLVQWYPTDSEVEAHPAENLLLTQKARYSGGIEHVLGGMTDAELTQNHRAYSAAPLSATRSQMLDAIQRERERRRSPLYSAARAARQTPGGEREGEKFIGSYMFRDPSGADHKYRITRTKGTVHAYVDGEHIGEFKSQSQASGAAKAHIAAMRPPNLYVRDPGEDMADQFTRGMAAPGGERGGEAWNVPGVKVSKGIAYFPSFEAAQGVRDQYPGSRIVAYEKGHAVQLRISGPYVGPDNDMQAGVAPGAVVRLRGGQELRVTRVSQPLAWGLNPGGGERAFKTDDVESVKMPPDMLVRDPGEDAADLFNRGMAAPGGERVDLPNIGEPPTTAQRSNLQRIHGEIASLHAAGTAVSYDPFLHTHTAYEPVGNDRIRVTPYWPQGTPVGQGETMTHAEALDRYQGGGAESVRRVIAGQVGRTQFALASPGGERHSPAEIEQAKQEIKRAVMGRFGGDLLGPALSGVDVSDEDAQRYLGGASIDDLLPGGRPFG